MAGSRQEDNYRLVRRGVDAYNRGDIEAVLEILDEDVEVYAPPAEFLNAGTYRGHQGFLEWIREWDEAWDEFRVEPEGFEPVGDNHLLVHVRQVGRGAGSGLELELRLTQLYEIHEGKATRFHLYPDREAAVAAAERLQREPGASP